MPNQSNKSEEMLEKLNKETAKIRWHEIARFFAAGKAVFIDESQDLIEIAMEFANDNRQKIESLLEQGQLGLVSDEQARAWADDDALVWAVVIAPWVLVQGLES